VIQATLALTIQIILTSKHDSPAATQCFFCNILNILFFLETLKIINAWIKLNA
jgi:hypothetical protein